MKWWEYLMVWRWVGSWWSSFRERRQHERQIEDRFKNLLNEGDENRGDLTDAMEAIRADRERRQITSLRKPRISSRPA